MVPQLDIFRMKKGEYVWLEGTITLDGAEARVQELGAAEPGEYLIFNQKTCGRIALRVEQAILGRDALRPRDLQFHPRHSGRPKPIVPHF